MYDYVFTLFCGLPLTLLNGPFTCWIKYRGIPNAILSL